MRSFCFILFSMILVCGCCAEGAAVDIVKYPRPAVLTDKRYNYRIEILKSALDITVPEYGAYKLVPSQLVIPDARMILEVKSGRKINVTFRPVNPAYRKELRMIDFPLLKGILGYRILLIRKSDRDLFAKIRNIEDLRLYKAGFVKGWVDIDIFSANNVAVEKGSSYSALFGMLKAGRFDFLSRGVNEVFDEYELYNSSGDFIIEDTLLIHYPHEVFIFVAKSDKHLASRIELGLKKMKADGSFDRIFNRYHSQYIQKAKFSKRRVIELVNPYFK